MLFTLAASFLFHLPDRTPEDLPVEMSLDEPPVFGVSGQDPQEEAPERPRGWGDVQLRRTDDATWTLTFAPTVRLISGKTRVRELASKPVWLDLGEHDIGFGPAPGFQLSLKVETRAVAWFLDVEWFHAQGRGTFPQNFAYDEGSFLANLPYHTSADLYMARAGFEVPGLIWRGRDIRITPFLGLEYPRVSLGIVQSGASQSTSEQYAQFIPVPIGGIAVEQRLSSMLTLAGRFYAGGIPYMPTPFIEGGRLYARVLSLRAELEVSWQVSSTIRLFAGIGYQYWTGRLESNEDGNSLRMEMPLFTIGIDIGL
jgi:hypothetical protein